MSRMRGFTLLESLIALSLFLIVLLGGYTAFLNQKQLYSEILPRTRAEEESNYRFLLLRQAIQDSAAGLRRHALLENAPVFFPDLQFGQAPTPNAFSVASVAGTPVPFRKAGSWYEVPSGAGIQPENVCLITGADQAGSYSWNFVRITDTENGIIVDRLRWTPFIEKPSPEHGTLVKVEMNGVRFHNGSLYRVNATGINLPFFDAVREFSYSWEPPLLTIRWVAGPVRLSCKVRI